MGNCRSEKGGNSYGGDSIRRQRRLKEQGIHFIDLGTSGEISGAQERKQGRVGGFFTDEADQ